MAKHTLKAERSAALTAYFTALAALLTYKMSSSSNFSIDTVGLPSDNTLPAATWGEVSGTIDGVLNLWANEFAAQAPLTYPIPVAIASLMHQITRPVIQADSVEALFVLEHDPSVPGAIDANLASALFGTNGVFLSVFRQPLLTGTSYLKQQFQFYSAKPKKNDSFDAVTQTTPFTPTVVREGNEFYGELSLDTVRRAAMRSLAAMTPELATDTDGQNLLSSIVKVSEPLFSNNVTPAERAIMALEFVTSNGALPLLAADILLTSTNVTEGLIPLAYQELANLKRVTKGYNITATDDDHTLRACQYKMPFAPAAYVLIKLFEVARRNPYYAYSLNFDDSLLHDYALSSMPNANVPAVMAEGILAHRASLLRIKNSHQQGFAGNYILPSAYEKNLYKAHFSSLTTTVRKQWRSLWCSFQLELEDIATVNGSAMLHSTVGSLDNTGIGISTKLTLPVYGSASEYEAPRISEFDPIHVTLDNSKVIPGYTEYGAGVNPYYKVSTASGSLPQIYFAISSASRAGFDIFPSWYTRKTINVGTGITPFFTDMKSQVDAILAPEDNAVWLMTATSKKFQGVAGQATRYLTECIAMPYVKKDDFSGRSVFAQIGYSVYGFCPSLVSSRKRGFYHISVNDYTTQTRTTGQRTALQIQKHGGFGISDFFSNILGPVAKTVGSFIGAPFLGDVAGLIGGGVEAIASIF